MPEINIAVALGRRFHTVDQSVRGQELQHQLNRLPKDKMFLGFIAFHLLPMSFGENYMWLKYE